MILTSTSNLYFYSYAGAVITQNSLKYGDISYEGKWYKMSIPLQKHFIIMIAETQRPAFLDGYGFIRLNLEGYMKVSY